MDLETLFQKQEAILELIKAYRVDWINPFFYFLHVLDNFWFYLFLVLLGWLKMGKLRGSHLFTLFFINYFIVFILKNSLELPRPPESLRLVPVYFFGFPSGAAANNMLILGYFISQTERLFYRFCLGLAIFLIAFSRLYLGVHYPHDVLSGFVIGLTILTIYYESIDSIMTITRKIPPFLDFFFAASVILLLFLKISWDKDFNVLYFISLGVYSGLACRAYLPFPYAERSINAIVCLFLIGVTSLIYSLVPKPEFPILYPVVFFVGLVPPLIGPWIANKIMYPRNEIGN
ncbi:phosphatase PAP2 family protein [bacterium]|jgi:membrane-associated phospholipid phosphatase|nr:phosphatase PAP2 family protein [bacterium]